jgi:PAS domain S-box-containing protein
MSPALPAFDRATRIAVSLFGGIEAWVVLIDGERVWRSGGSLVGSPSPANGSRWVIANDKALWVADRAADPGAQTENYHAHGRPRFWAASPVRLADGSAIGALAVSGREQRPYDEELAERLQDLADSIGDECSRARATEIAVLRDRELRNAREVMAAFVKSIPVEAVMTDRDLQVLTATPRWLERFGVQEAEAIGTRLYDISPEAFGHFRGDFEGALVGESVRRDRLRVVDDGKPRWFDLEITPWRDETGAIAGVISAAHDVSEAVAAMRSSGRTQQRLQLATEMADIHVYDIDYHRRTYETAGKDLFPQDEATQQEVLKSIFGRDDLRYVDPRDHELVAEAIRRFSEEDAAYQLEYRMLRQPGEEFWVAEVMRAIKNREGRTYRVVGAMQDITARKLAERALIEAKDGAEAANLAKSTFLATMSHEIRTPLNGVLGMAQAMDAAPLAPAQRERLDVIRQSGETLLAVLNDVLDLSKIEAGKLELEEAQFDVGEVAGSVHAAFSAVAAHKGIDFSLKVTRAAEGTYTGDATRVRQVLNNLVSNALKFTEAGRVSVNVGRKAGALTLTVSDTGIGMSDGQQATLFQKFEQADASTTRRFGGTGLGLAICRELVELMGGLIAVRSAEGRGSTLVATLPLPRSRRRAAEAAPNRAASVASSDPSAIRVLAAEDNPINQLVLKTLLSQVGIEPTIVGDGVDAVAAWESGRWDVILMDVQMPRMDGPTAARFIRARELAQRRPRTPIIALTANAMTHQVAGYLAAGMDSFVAKPIEVSRLFEALEAALASAPAARAGAA